MTKFPPFYILCIFVLVKDTGHFWNILTNLNLSQMFYCCCITVRKCLYRLNNKIHCNIINITLTLGSCGIKSNFLKKSSRKCVCNLVQISWGSSYLYWHNDSIYIHNNIAVKKIYPISDHETPNN